VGKDLGGCLARKNAKIPEVVKANNYQLIHLRDIVQIF
jgi:hypothetical protein